MCFYKFKRSNKEDAVQALKRYVCADAEPVVNHELREGIVSKDTDLLDTLFTEYTGPSILYRHINLYKEIQLGLLSEPTFLSTTKSFESYYGNLFGEDLGCLRIHVGSADLKAIDVDSFAIDGASEEEVILPRNLQLEVTSIKKYSTDNFDEFLREMRCNNVMNSRNLVDDGINSYTVYDVKIIES